MPPVNVPAAALKPFGDSWRAGKKLSKTSSMGLGRVFDRAVAASLAAFLGDIPIRTANRNALGPSEANVVEVGEILVVGGVRPQNFDAAYRPDGVRFAFDSKTLNDTKSIGKNWQNMVNDLGAEAATVHSRFPYAVVGFMVVLPLPCVSPQRLTMIIATLGRLARRVRVSDPDYQTEAVSLVLWDSETGDIDPSRPDPVLYPWLRVENFSKHAEEAYMSRYAGFAPH